MKTQNCVLIKAVLFHTKKFLKNFQKTLDFWISISYNIITVREHLTSTQGKMQKGEPMNEEMNQAEELVKQTEEKMIYKILLILKEAKDKEEAIKKIEALLK
ncbi:hypothetical protein [Criibacterium bergeronii]|uniref:hypothetical protein n=1 Tax=Criibacterium bergeronii TaxID=1871336 RepID=UPI0011855BD4|nr:hypothetical protein [Criibacterium bergeronii]